MTAIASQRAPAMTARCHREGAPKAPLAMTRFAAHFRSNIFIDFAKLPAVSR